MATRRLGVPALAPTRLPERALRHLPWWSDLLEGPVDIYSLPWIIIITGFGLTSFVYLFVSAGFANINGELIEAAQVAGSSPRGVFFKVILPLLRPTLVYGGGVALLLGLGQFTGPLLLGRNAGINVLTTDMYLAMSAHPAALRHRGRDAARRCCSSGSSSSSAEGLLGDQRRFVTHGGRAFRPEGRPSKLGALGIVLYSFVATILPLGALAIVSLNRFWSADIDPGRVHALQLPGAVR